MDFQKLKDFRNTHNPFCEKLGILVEEIQAGCAKVTKHVTEEDLNPAGLAHGGVYFSMADTAPAPHPASPRLFCCDRQRPVQLSARRKARRYLYRRGPGEQGRPGPSASMMCR